ncbi:putative methyltransferase-domain-containing protein [Hysterangium stoloniferum]|nr:putative methyltransferase-domain-containing protein [Hysterangium stoloniferum]
MITLSPTDVDLSNVPELLHFKCDESEEQSDIIPSQLPTTAYQLISLPVTSGQDETPSFDVKLTVDAGPGCGGVAWPAGRVLSNYLSTRKSLQGLSVVELGSGTGLVGIVAGLMHAESVWITDQEPLLELMRTNVSLNGLATNVQVAELDWGTDIPPTIPRSPDLVLAADCVYFEPAFELLVSTLSALATSRKTEILFCYKKRRKADKRFFNLLKKEFTWEDVKDDPRREEYCRESIFLYRLLKK